MKDAKSIRTAVLLLGAFAGHPCRADEAAAPLASDRTGSAPDSFWTQWYAQSDAAKETQPHWMTPLVTVTPRLEQEVRYDQVWQDRPKGATLDNFGNGKGLELIPASSTEIILGVPAYEERWTAKGRVVGAADESFLLKYRFRSGNEEHGNFVITGFLGLSLPTGSLNFTTARATVTPTLAAGKGWGTRARGFDIQSTIGYVMPVADEPAIGRTLSWNTAVQAHVLKVLWPELESTYTRYQDGPNAGQHQLAWTVGTVVGRFDLGSRARLIIGSGYQWTVGRFRSYLHNWLLTARLAF